MRKLAIALAIAAMPMMAQQPVKKVTGWTWVDPNDHGGYWDPIRGVDKRGHSCIGALTASIVFLYADRNGWKHPELWGILAAFVVGYAKEIWDMRRPECNVAEVSDVIATGLGGVVAVPLVRIKW